MKSTYNEILQNMKAAYNKELGREIAENSIDEKKLEAIASELYGLSCYGDFILKQAFVQTATGEYLDRHGALRDCKRKLGTYAKFAVNISLCIYKVKRTSALCKSTYALKSVAGLNLIFKLYIVHLCKERCAVLNLICEQTAGRLSHHFAEDNTRNNRIARKMSL